MLVCGRRTSSFHFSVSACGQTDPPSTLPKRPGTNPSRNLEPVGKQLLPVAAATAANYSPVVAIDVRPFFVFIAGADTGAHQDVCYCTDERDWGNLLPELVSMVADLALRSDVTDNIRLRAVCKEWRVAAEADPMLVGMDPSFFPRNWQMVDWESRGEETSRCCTQNIRVFNPVTRAFADLPGVFLSDRVNLPMRCDAAGFIYETTESDADLTVVLCVTEGLRRMEYTKPGDTVWRVVDDKDGSEPVPYSDGALSVRGRLFVPTPTGEVRKLELRPRPHMVYVARQEARHKCDILGVFSYLLPNTDDGMLLLVRNVILKSVEEVCWVNIMEGSLILVQDHQDVDDLFVAWLTLRIEY